MGSPTTVIARWPVANAQSAIPILARVIRDNLGGVGTGRRAIQIRPFRLPGSQSGSGKGSGSTRTDKIMGDKKAPDDGRNLYVVRCVTNSNAEEQVMVFVEDPVAPLRKLDDGDATPTLRLDSMMDVVESAPPPSDEPKPSHTRWTYCQLGGSPRPTAGPSHATPFDAFLQRVLLGPGTSSAGSSSNVGSWIPRSTAISVEGFVFASGGTAGSMGDWEINVGSISVKGGAAGGNSRGVLVEATFLAVPYLPDGSTYVKDFLSSLFPAPALAAGEIEWITVPNEDFYEARLVTPPDVEKREVAGEWEWNEKHTSFAFVKMLKQEGLL